MMNYQERGGRRHFALIEIRFLVKFSLSKNKRVVAVVNKVLYVCRRRNALLLSIPRMIEKWNYLYLFIIHDADVIKYLCLSFSWFVLDFCSLFSSNDRTLLRLCDKSRAWWMQNGWEKKREINFSRHWFQLRRTVIEHSRAFQRWGRELKLLITHLCFCVAQKCTFKPSINYHR